jgi:hypothetical protein
MFAMSKITVADYFGGCPQCGRNDGCLTIPGANWFRCDAHKLKWTPGHIFNWKSFDLKTLRKNFEVLESYTVTESALLQGTWSTDPNTRKKELRERHRGWRRDRGDITVTTERDDEELPF